MQSVSIDEALIDISAICFVESGSNGVDRAEGAANREQLKADAVAQKLRDDVLEKTGCENERSVDVVDQFVLILLRWPLAVLLNISLNDRISILLFLEASGHKGVDVVPRAVVDEVLQTDLIVLQAPFDILFDTTGDEESEEGRKGVLIYRSGHTRLA